MKFNTQKEYEEQLKDNLKEFLNNCGNWSAEDFLKIKKYLFPINNHISYLLGKRFLDALGIPDDTFKYTDMNNNGYDLELVFEDKLIIAEIKGNIPCGKDQKTYGANQSAKIKENLNALLDINKKTKSKLTVEEFDNAYKFFIILENNQDAIRKLEDNTNKKTERYKFHYPNSICWDEFKKDKINIIFIDFK